MAKEIVLAAQTYWKTVKSGRKNVDCWTVDLYQSLDSEKACQNSYFSYEGEVT